MVEVKEEPGCEEWRRHVGGQWSLQVSAMVVVVVVVRTTALL